MGGKDSSDAVNLIDVLIINDVALDQELLSAYLNEYDVSFCVAASKDGAFKKLGDFTFKLILIDAAFTLSQGYNMVEKIRADLQLTIPIVAITTENVDLTKTECFSTGINGYFTKPISKIELVGVLTQFLPGEALSTNGVGSFVPQTIDLSYLKEISMGDVGYELEMAEKFVEMISDEMIQLMDCLERGNVELLKRLVHKMRSTIYLMGLGPKLITTIEAIEYENLSAKQLKFQVDVIITVCEKAKEEVLVFLDNAR
ncbi:response regulator [Pedobacter sp. UBA5917]|jgi:CheY-like chemotaxis protein|uniref:response regulator n=1 Tax=Pedobacter sp. UBA5917 TaxID=1947061 RepID=UPI0025FCFE58|nr:response regulator [Pedobacter sp. UBA5917]